MSTRPQHQNFIDWMKTLGMFLIVYGHVVGDPFNVFNQISQPVYTKQLGVAFFVFITGWSLANDNRPGLRVVFNRLFAIYFYGILFALLLSSIYIFTIHDINESNYLPFFLGINSFLNYFPANPTTWYIGTYIHIILFWYFFLQGRKIEKKHLLLAFIVENTVRYFLLSSGHYFVAYMLLPNWLTVFLMGMYLHEKKDIKSKQPTSIAVFLLVIWSGMLLTWAFIGSDFAFNKSFPFRRMSQDIPGAVLLTSVLITIIYTFNTRFFFQIARYLPGNRVISFFSRNTLIIFIIHMPINYGLFPVLYSLIETVWIKKALLIIILFIGSALISELIQRIIKLKPLSEKAWPVFNQAAKLLRLSK